MTTRISPLHTRLLYAALTVAVLAAAWLGASRAEAAPGCTPENPECPTYLGRIGTHGSGAGELFNPRSVAADPVSGHIFVADALNPRVSVFNAQGQFLKAWGWGVLDGTAEPQVCTAATGCLAGLAGPGPGQLSSTSFAAAIDAAGDIWVMSAARRLQKFTASGEFVLMIGGEVNKTKVALREEQEANSETVGVTQAEENLCTAASGDLCGAATGGTGPGEFGEQIVGNSIDVGPTGVIYVGDFNRIQKFDEDGSYLGVIPLAGGGRTHSLTVTPAGRLFVISEGVLTKISNGHHDTDSRVVREIGSSGEELSQLLGEWQGRKTPREPVAVASDAAGNVYVVARVVYDVPVKPTEDPKWEEPWEVVAFDPSGSRISFDPGRAGFGRPTDTSPLVGVATNIVGDGSGAPGEVLVAHYDTGGANSIGGPKSYIDAYGTPFENPPGPATIDDSHAALVGTTDAAVRAKVNPHYSADTTFQVQYGTGICEAGECTSVSPVTPSSLGGDTANAPVPVEVGLHGLAPGTTYHYRLVADNEAGGPVYGPEGTLRTFLVPETLGACSNDAVRFGPAGRLPDCRAYEMVSPVDKSRGEVLTGISLYGFNAELNQADPDGSAMTYSSTQAFADPQSAPYTSQYMALRNPPGSAAGGWVSRSISPPREGLLETELDTQFQIFSTDLSKGWLITDSEPALSEGAIAGQRNLYLRDNATDAYQVVCPAPVPPPGRFLEAQGMSEDGSRFIFRTPQKLTPDAAEGEAVQIYECVDGTELRLVSVLPNGQASPDGGSVGMANNPPGGNGLRFNRLATAVSKDASRIFWTARGNNAGPLYVRVDGTRTIEIAADGATFHAASPDGTRVLYTVGEELREASVEDEFVNSRPIASGASGFLGASEDTMLVYFVSGEDLDGSGAAEADGRNLYLYDANADSYAFIGELSEDDLRVFPNSDPRRRVLTPVSGPPVHQSSRVTSDGLHALFSSTASLTGYDNTDLESGEADAEVFRYDAEADELLCISCNPSGARPRGQNAGKAPANFWAAATVPPWENAFHGPRVLAEDGDRLFFESYDGLVLADTNGAQDVYQWEADGTGSCDETLTTYVPKARGCIDLISSGKSQLDSEFIDASVGGRDVFFKTDSSLWPGDPGRIDIYDARVGGGFPPPTPPKAACEGEACQVAVPTPDFRTPSSATFVGPGNTARQTAGKRCRKSAGRAGGRAKARCSKARKVKKRSHNTNWGSGR